MDFSWISESRWPFSLCFLLLFIYLFLIFSFCSGYVLGMRIWVSDVCTYMCMCSRIPDMYFPDQYFPGVVHILSRRSSQTTILGSFQVRWSFCLQQDLWSTTARMKEKGDLSHHSLILFFSKTYVIYYSCYK